MPFQLDLGSATEGAQPLDLAQEFGDAVQLDQGRTGVAARVPDYGQLSRPGNV